MVSKTIQLLKEKKITELDALSKSEYKIAIMMISGMTYKEISIELNVNYNTITKHSSNIFLKLGVKNKNEFIRKYT